MRSGSGNIQRQRNDRHPRRWVGLVVLLLSASCLQVKGLTISNLIFDPDDPENPPTFDAPFFAEDGRTRLSGDSFLVQIWTGPTGPSEERPLTKAVGLKEGAGAGYFAFEEADILDVDRHGDFFEKSNGTARWTDVQDSDGLSVRLRVWERPSSSSEAEYGSALLRLELEAHWDPVLKTLSWAKELGRTIGLGVQTYPGQNAVAHITSLSNITLSRGGEHSVRLVDGQARVRQGPPEGEDEPEGVEGDATLQARQVWLLLWRAQPYS